MASKISPCAEVLARVSDDVFCEVLAMNGKILPLSLDPVLTSTAEQIAREKRIIRLLPRVTGIPA